MHTHNLQAKRLGITRNYFRNADEFEMKFLTIIAAILFELFLYIKIMPDYAATMVEENSGIHERWGIFKLEAILFSVPPFSRVSRITAPGKSEKVYGYAATNSVLRNNLSLTTVSPSPVFFEIFVQRAPLFPIEVFSRTLVIGFTLIREGKSTAFSLCRVSRVADFFC